MGKHITVSAQKFEKAPKIVRVVIYARVSSQKQLDKKEEDSIKSQIRHNKRFAEAFGEAGEKWVVVKVIVDDGRTGRNDHRDGLKEVKHLVETGAVDVVLVNRLSRAFRNTKLAHEFEEFLQIHSVRLVSRMEPGSTDTASEKFVRSIHHSMSEFASNQISEDVKRSIQTRLEAGLTNGGTPKPGYDSRDGHLFIVEEDAAIIREIFEMAENGMLPSEIANDLNRRRIRTRKRKSRSGNTTGGQRYRPEGIIKILRDPIYKGIVIHEGVEYPLTIDAIVTRESWEKVQVALDRRKKRKNLTQNRDKNFFPLKGIIRCGCCNSAMKPSFSTKRKADGTTEKYFYYLCSKHEKSGDESTCEIARVPARTIELLIIETFSEIAANPEVANRLIEKAPKANTSKIRKLAKERQLVRRQLKDLDEEVDEMTDKILQFAGTAIGDNIDKRVKALTDNKNELIASEVELNREIDALQSDIISSDKLRNALEHFADAIKCLSEDEQRELYQLLFKSVIVQEGGKAVDPINGKTRHKRAVRRQLSLEMRLRTEAIHTLFGESEVAMRRRSGLTIPMEIAHCRKKPTENCALLAPVHKEIGQKTPETRKRPQKTEHEIHRALRWKKEMEEQGIGQNELARRKGLTNAAVSQTMRLLDLNDDAIRILVELNDPKQISRVGRRKLFDLLRGAVKEQTSQIIRLIKGY